MSNPITYQVTFRSGASWAVEEITAESPHAALAEARAIAADPARLGALAFEAYGGELPVNDIAVEADGDELAIWLDDELRLRLAADDLFAALERALAALNSAPRFDVPSLDCDSYAIAAECSRAIAKARPEPAP